MWYCLFTILPPPPLIQTQNLLPRPVASKCSITFPAPLSPGGHLAQTLITPFSKLLQVFSTCSVPMLSTKLMFFSYFYTPRGTVLYVAQTPTIEGFPGGSVVKNLPSSAEDARNVGSIPGLGRSPGEGNGSSIQYSCLENLERGGLQSMGWQRVRHC